jgi:hypothetical protein
VLTVLHCFHCFGEKSLILAKTIPHTTVTATDLKSNFKAYVLGLSSCEKDSLLCVVPLPRVSHE